MFSVQSQKWWCTSREMNYSKNISACRYLLQVVAVYCCIVSMDQLLLTGYNSIVCCVLQEYRHDSQ